MAKQRRSAARGPAPATPPTNPTDDSSPGPDAGAPALHPLDDPRFRRALATAFVLSGFAGLVYETAWTRLLLLAFGATTEALSTVLAAFMGGLAIGSALGGRLADRRSPRAALRLYVACELGVAGLCVLSAMLLVDFPRDYVAVERVIGGGRLLRAFTAALVLLPPTVLMGATLPVLVRVCAAPGAALGRTVGWLYAVNTVGSVAGAFATGFLLLLWLGVSHSIYFAALLNVCAALLVLRLSGRAAQTTALPAEPAADAATTAAPERRRRMLLLAAAAIAGAVALGLEVLWTRTLVLTVGSSAQATALMLTTFLGGIALGSAVYARLAHRIAGPERFAAILQVGIALGSVLLLQVATQLPLLYVSMWSALHDSPIGLVLLRLVPSAALMLVPTLLMGATLPALTRAYAGGSGAVGSDVGTVYAANTAGAIAGSLLVGQWVLPGLGVAQAMVVVAAAALVGATMALLSTGVPRDGRAFRAFRTWALVALPALLLAGALRLSFWDPRVMGRGLAYVAEKQAGLLRHGDLRKVNDRLHTLYYRDGAESSVLVYETSSGSQRMFVVNGRHEATTDANDMRNQYLLGHLPALLHRGKVHSGLVIALGSGMTTGCLALHADRVTLVELNAAVLPAARLFKDWNHDAVDHPRVSIRIDDGRHFLLTTDEKFDVITVDPIHPSVSGSEALYSIEQYRLVQQHLNPGGVAAQWLPLYQVGVEDARSIAATFQAVFPDAQAWVNGLDVILIGGAGVEPRPATEVLAALQDPAITASLRRVGQERLETLEAGFALGAPGFARYVAGAPISRDDKPVLEFSLPWKMYDKTVDPNLLEIFSFGAPMSDSVLAGLPKEQLDAAVAARSAVQMDVIAIALRHTKQLAQAQRMFQRALQFNPADVLARDGVKAN